MSWDSLLWTIMEDTRQQYGIFRYKMGEVARSPDVMLKNRVLRTGLGRIPDQAMRGWSYPTWTNYSSGYIDRVLIYTLILRDVQSKQWLHYSWSWFFVVCGSMIWELAIIEVLCWLFSMLNPTWESGSWCHIIRLVGELWGNRSFQAQSFPVNSKEFWDQGQPRPWTNKTLYILCSGKLMAHLWQWITFRCHVPCDFRGLSWPRFGWSTQWAVVSSGMEPRINVDHGTMVYFRGVVLQS